MCCQFIYNVEIENYERRSYDSLKTNKILTISLMVRCVVENFFEEKNIIVLICLRMIYIANLVGRKIIIQSYNLGK